MNALEMFSLEKLRTLKKDLRKVGRNVRNQKKTLVTSHTNFLFSKMDDKMILKK